MKAESSQLVEYTQASDAERTELEVNTTIRLAIAERLFEAPQRLDIRLLWQATETHFYRVNVWSGVTGAARIERSVFVRARRAGDSWLIEDCTQREAA